VVPPLHCLVLVNLFMFASSRRRGLIQVGSTTEFSQVVVLDLCSFGLLEIFVVFLNCGWSDPLLGFVVDCGLLWPHHYLVLCVMAFLLVLVL
jgi:hypothetical protein